jgi:hypothetical protein
MGMLSILGGLVFLAGAALWIGNVTRAFPTFPFAGYLTMLVGGVMWRAGKGG